MKKLELTLLSAATFAVLAFVLIVGYCIIFTSKDSKPQTFKYNGHDFIKFSNGVEHSPDCDKCYGIFE